MPIRQVYVPYRQGYNIGVGADLSTGSPMGKAVNGTATKVAGAGAATVQFRVQRIQSTEELEEALGIDAEASYGCAAFGAGVSARFSFAKKTKVQSSSLFMLVTAQVELAFESVDDPVLSDDADGFLDRPDIFVQRYGNVFVRGVQRGGVFVGTLRIETTSSQQSTDVAGELAGSYGLFSADIQTKFSNIQTKYQCSIYVDMYHEGGPVDLQITDPADPRQLLGNANSFLSSFRTQPEEQVAKPYFVTLAPLSIARSRNLPLNTADVEHAQDVLIACTKARSRILDKINLIEYILGAPDKFTFPPNCNAAALAKLQGDFESDQDIVAQCASEAIDSPHGALLPADFATAKGKQYPKGVLPEEMPVPKAGKFTKIPDFTNCTSWIECNSLAVAKGLTAHQDFSDALPGVFKVLSVSPPFDTVVPEGTVVKITTQRAKVGGAGGVVLKANPWALKRPAAATRIIPR